MARRRRARVGIGGLSPIDVAQKRFAEKIPEMPGNFADGMSAFFGQDVGDSLPVAKFAAKVVPGLEDVWRRNLEVAFGVRPGRDVTPG